MENYRFTRDGDTTHCWYDIKPDLGFVGIGVHENPEEAKRLAYEDAVSKAKVISIKKLSFYHWWKQNKNQV